MAFRDRPRRSACAPRRPSAPNPDDRGRPADRPPARRRRACPALVVALLGALVALAPVGGPAAAAAPATARFVSVAPARLADTRGAACACTRIDASTIRVRVAGRGGVPAGASAAALTVTAASTTAAGYATVWPSGRARPATSAVNWGPGETRANGTIVPLGRDGSVDVFVEGSFAAAAVVIDVTGAFVPAASARAGQFRPLEATRALDTRAGAAIVAGRTVRVPLPDGVPAGATALVVNVTATGAARAGYLTAWPAGAARPPTSTVNTDAGGQTRAATAIVPASPAGIDLAASMTTHAIVDVVGWFTGAGAPAAASGLFVPLDPARLFDTRRARSPLAIDAPLRAYTDDDAVAPLLARAVGSASALVLNATVANGVGAGFLTTLPARGERPPTSSLNWRSGETVANLVVAPTSTYGVAFVASATVDVIADVTGYFTGTPVAIGAPAAAGGAVRDPDAVALVAAGVTAEAMTTLAGADIGFLPGGNLPANDTCVGHVGVAGSSMTGIAADVWQISHQELSLARGLVHACTNSLQGPSAAAHEAAHLLIDRWTYEPTNAAAQRQRRAIVDGLDGAGECLAEAVAQAMFAARGIGPYQIGYGGVYQACAGSAPTRSLARQILTITG